ncbi:unnamed protein product [Trichobilharzia regenti]|nr:unnamed protein product [Trichobilharzia regenti]
MTRYSFSVSFFLLFLIDEQAVHPGNQRNVKTTEIKDQQYCSDCNDLKSKPGYCTSLNKGNSGSVSSNSHVVRSNNNGTFENERAIQSGSCSQINSTSKSSHTACPTNNKPTSNVSTKLSRHISMPISTASTGKYMSHLQSHMDKTHNYCQPTMMSMSREANNPVIVRGNKTTSPVSDSFLYRHLCTIMKCLFVFFLFSSLSTYINIRSMYLMLSVY